MRKPVMKLFGVRSGATPIEHGLFAAAAYFFRVVRRNPTLFILTDTLAQLIACFAVCGVLSYLVMSTNLPLADGELAAIDRALGFDWPRFIRWIQARPAVDYTLW